MPAGRSRKTKIGMRGRLQNQIRNEFEVSTHFFGLNVRRNGPQPSIFVRSFSPITKTPYLCPDCKALPHFLAVSLSTQEMPSRSKVGGNGTKRRKKPLGLARRFEPSHGSLPLPGRLV